MLHLRAITSRLSLLPILSAGLLWGTQTLAHHSYSDYERSERLVLEGTITKVMWGNPHILLFVNDGQQEMRIEWVTTTGADKTGVPITQFNAGDFIKVTGSRNRNPEQRIMTLIKELEMPATNWRWISPSLRTQ